MPGPIENHGVIGDLYTAALVSTDGAIDFLCWPRFDAPTIFAALLDPERGGHFTIAPQLDQARTKQIYLSDTNVLFTRFLSDQGVAELTDFMPIETGRVHHDLVRRARTVRGEVNFRLICAPRFDYGRATHEATGGGDVVIFRSRGPDGTTLRLRSTVPLTIVDGDAVAEFVLRAGQQAEFILEDARPDNRSREIAHGSLDDALARTVAYWRRWVARGTYVGRWRETVVRSALTLKLLTSAEHGSLVAAPTFGLPEKLGGARNWDYRYTWIRDASFTLTSLMRIGYVEEASAFMGWLERRCSELSEDGSLQILYGIDGRKIVSEESLEHWSGYQGSVPVRIGNGAAQQLQLDIYGELMDAIEHYDLHGAPVSHDLWGNIVRLVNWVAEHWHEKDEGIWEVRGGRKEFLLSRVMCWVALDRAIRIAQRRSRPAPLAEWYETRDRIYASVFAEFWDAKKMTFVQHRNADTTDASTLLLPLMSFISPTDPRWLSTMRAIEKELVEDPLVFRYRPAVAAPDGMIGEEGTFCMASFWLADCLAKAGEVDRGRFIFEKMLGYANHLGLFPEELGPSGEHLGNFPQAFTHLSLIGAARTLDQALSAAGRD